MACRRGALRKRLRTPQLTESKERVEESTHSFAAVVARAQVVLGGVVVLIHIGALVRQEAAPLLTLRAPITWIHDRGDEQLGARMGVLTTVLRIKKRCRDLAGC